MNLFLLSQASSIGLFHSLGNALQERGFADQIGYYVSEEKYYKKFIETVPDFEENTAELIKSWDIINVSHNTSPDLEYLDTWESKLSGETLWNALVSDRRIIYGDRFDFRVDYGTKFTHEAALTYLGHSLSVFDEAFTRFQPDLVIGFVCSTLSEYVAYLVARSKGIPYLNLRPTRVSNFMGVGVTPYEPSELVAREFEKYEAGHSDKWLDQATTYLESTRGSQAKYEGVVTASRKTAASSTESVRFLGISKLRHVVDVVRAEIEGRRSIPLGDRGTPGLIMPALYKRVLNPLRARRIHRRFSNDYVTPEDMSGKSYAFFPLHMEPEVTLLMYSRSYLNQIEVIRNVAYNLPVGMKLVVKEHPVALGKRKIGYYRKLLQIMNVELADPAYPAGDFIKGCALVANVAGSVGFEAAIAQKPVMTFGTTPYDLLPDSMVKQATIPSNIGPEIRELLDGHHHDEKALKSLIAAIMSTSIPVNWYTNLLGRRAYAEHENTYQQDITTLCNGLIETYNKHIANGPALEPARFSD